MNWEPAIGMDEYLSPTKYCDSDNREVQTVASEIIKNAESAKDAALRVFHYVRDEILFGLDEHTPASDTLRRRTGQCCTKTSLQIALLRAVQIAARYHLVDVHKDCLKGLIAPTAYDGFEDVINDHPWCECYLSGRWIACETLFDKRLYESSIRYGIIRSEDMPSIEWDGENDLKMLSAWVLKDKDTCASMDDFMDKELQAFAEFWPVLRQSNEHTMQLRAKVVGTEG